MNTAKKLKFPSELPTSRSSNPLLGSPQPLFFEKLVDDLKKEFGPFHLRLFKVKEVGKIIGFPSKDIYRLSDDGLLTIRKIGKKRCRILGEDLLRWLAQLQRR